MVTEREAVLSWSSTAFQLLDLPALNLTLPIINNIYKITYLHFFFSLMFINKVTKFKRDGYNINPKNASDR